jgi:hypothetical protein
MSLSKEDADNLRAAVAWIRMLWEKDSEFFAGRSWFTYRGQDYALDVPKLAELVSRLVAEQPPEDV